MVFIGDSKGRNTYCEHCVYWGKYTKTCGYYLMEGKRRCNGSPPELCEKFRKGTPVYDKSNWKNRGTPRLSEVIEDEFII